MSDLLGVKTKITCEKSRSCWEFATGLRRNMLGPAPINACKSKQKSERGSDNIQYCTFNVLNFLHHNLLEGAYDKG